MQTAFARYLVVLTLLSATGASAQEGKIIQLKQPVIGCENKADLKDFPYELPKMISTSKMPLPYREGRCIRLAPGRLIITQVQGTYTCLHRRGHSCLWVRSEDVGVPMIGDFGTPGQGGRRAPAESAPEFTPLR